MANVHFSGMQLFISGKYSREHWISSWKKICSDMLSPVILNLKGLASGNDTEGLRTQFTLDEVQHVLLGWSVTW